MFESIFGLEVAEFLNEDPTIRFIADNYLGAGELYIPEEHPPQNRCDTQKINVKSLTGGGREGGPHQADEQEQGGRLEGEAPREGPQDPSVPLPPRWGLGVPLPVHRHELR